MTISISILYIAFVLFCRCFEWCAHYPLFRNHLRMNFRKKGILDTLNEASTYAEVKQHWLTIWNRSHISQHEQNVLIHILNWHDDNYYDTDNIRFQIQHNKFYCLMR